MQTGRSVAALRQGTAKETVLLFVLPPLLTLVVVASTLLLFTSYLSHRSTQTTYVEGSAWPAGRAAPGWEFARSASAAALH